MSINTRLAEQLVTMLPRHGFDVTLKTRGGVSADDLTPDTPTWTELATVKGVWDGPRSQSKALKDQGPAILFTRAMTIAYRSDLKATQSAIGLRAYIDGVHFDVLSVARIGENVGLRLTLNAEPAQ